MIYQYHASIMTTYLEEQSPADSASSGTAQAPSTVQWKPPSFQEITRECYYSSPNTSSLGNKNSVKRATRKASQLDILKQTSHSIIYGHVSVYKKCEMLIKKIIKFTASSTWAWVASATWRQSTQLVSQFPTSSHKKKWTSWSHFPCTLTRVACSRIVSLESTKVQI